jgi:hypothetical protein
MSVALDKDIFNNIIRAVKKGQLDRAKQIRTLTFLKLKELGLNRNASKAVDKTPAGSDQIDVGSVVAWVQKIQADDAKAVGQLITLDATAHKRVTS